MEALQVFSTTTPLLVTHRTTVRRQQTSSKSAIQVHRKAVSLRTVTVVRTRIGISIGAEGEGIFTNDTSTVRTAQITVQIVRLEIIHRISEGVIIQTIDLIKRRLVFDKRFDFTIL